MQQGFLISLALFLSIPAFTQNARLEGVIQGGSDEQNLPGVSIYLKEIQLGTSSNAHGYFSIEKIVPGNYTLIISAIGYEKVDKNISLTAGQNMNLGKVEISEKISELNEVVISGGESGIKDIPGSVQYISPKELDAFSYTDINRSLRSVPGVNIQEEDGYGLRPNIGLRGAGVERSSKISLMEDGVLIAPAPYVAPSAYYFPTMGRMNGLEIMKGSSQIQYGPYTTGGALNLISTPIPNRLAGKADMIFGSYGTQQIHAWVGNQYKRVAYMVETFQYGSDGFKQLDGGGNTGFEKTDFLGKIRVNTGEEAKIYQSLTAKVGVTNEHSNETYLGLTDEDFILTPNRRYYGSQKDQINSTHRQISLTHSVKFNSHLEISTTAYRNEFDRNWYKLDKVSDSSGSSYSISSILDSPKAFGDAMEVVKGRSSVYGEELHVKANNRSYYAQGIQTKLIHSFVTGKISHKITAGARIHQDQMDRFQWVDDFSMQNGTMVMVNQGIPGTESNRIYLANTFAAFVQYQLKLNKLTLIPGLRYENMVLSSEDYGKTDVERVGSDLTNSSNSVSIIIPGLGANFQFNKKLSSFAGIHKGFAPPGTTQGTLPEESINYEVGVRFSKTSLTWQAIAFYNDYENLLGSDMSSSGGTGSTETYNGGKSKSMGLELMVSYDLISSLPKTKFALPFLIAYTYADARFLSDFNSDFEGWNEVENGDHLPYMASHQLSVTIGLEHHSFTLNLSTRYISEMRTAPGQDVIPDNEKINAHFTLDASGTYRLQENLRIFASVTNFTNQVYEVARRPAGLRPGMPIAYNLGVKASF